MVHSCVAYNCTQRSNTASAVSFHRFPSNNPALEKLWIEAVRRKKWKPSAHSRICSKHFSDNDYSEKKTLTGGRILKPEAVPRIFNFPAHLQKLTDSISTDSKENYVHQEHLKVDHGKMITRKALQLPRNVLQGLSMSQSGQVIRVQGSHVAIPDNTQISQQEEYNNKEDSILVSEENDALSDVSQSSNNMPSCTLTPTSEAGVLSSPVVEHHNSENVEEHIEVEETSQSDFQTSHAKTLKRSIEHSLTETLDSGKNIRLETFAMKEIFDDNRRLMLRNKELERELLGYKEREKAWSKRRNVLKCRLQRREKLLGKLKSVVATFEEDTELDGEHASFALKKLEGLPLDIFENEMKNRGRSAHGRRYNTKIKEFALTLYYYSPAAYNFCRFVPN